MISSVQVSDKEDRKVTCRACPLYSLVSFHFIPPLVVRTSKNVCPSALSRNHACLSATKLLIGLQICPSSECRFVFLCCRLQRVQGLRDVLLSVQLIVEDHCHLGKIK